MHMRRCGLLYLTVAYGFVRIYSQPYFLSHTSATSLALSDLAVQALTIRSSPSAPSAAFARQIALVPDPRPRRQWWNRRQRQ